MVAGLSRLGAYEILGPLGAGGMGEVKVLDFGLAHVSARAC